MSKLVAMARMRCPRCHEGKLYQDPNPFHFKNLHKMPPSCDKCGQPFSPEPGFYYGAMYMSYGLSVLLFLLHFFVLEVWFSVSGLVFITTYTLNLLILFPLIFRYSRTLYIHLFYGYEPGAKEKYRTNP